MSNLNETTRIKIKHSDDWEDENPTKSKKLKIDNESLSSFIEEGEEGEEEGERENKVEIKEGKLEEGEEGENKVEMERRVLEKKKKMENSFLLFFLTLLITGMTTLFILFYVSSFTWIKPKMNAYDNFYDSRCLLINTTINQDYFQYDSVIFTFIINHNFKNYTTEVKKLCSKYQPDCPMYETDWFSCKLVYSENSTYSFDIDRGTDLRDNFILLLFFGTLILLFDACLICLCLQKIYNLVPN